MLYKDLLPTRIPEFQQGDNALREYLEAVGELFDEYSAAIENMDHYRDPTKVSEPRLKELASQFALNFPRNLNASLRRIILRDIQGIYQQMGTHDFINWIFRLIGWDVEIEDVWLLNPERFDPKMKTVFGLDDYEGEQAPAPIPDFTRRDFTSFMLGEAFTDSTGTYFRGKRFFDLEDTYTKNEIVGEYYKPTTKVRTPDKVMKTPYIFVRVSTESYNIFISPYTDPDTGETWEYTTLEFFSVVENILRFFLFENFRTTSIRIIAIVTEQLVSDSGVVSDAVVEEWEYVPVSQEETAVSIQAEESHIVHPLVEGFDIRAGVPAHFLGKDMALSSISFGESVTTDGFQIVGTDGTPDAVRIEAEDPVARVGGDHFALIGPHEEEVTFSTPILAYYTAFNGYEADGATPKESAPHYQPIVLRNPSSIASAQFNPTTVPGNAYYLGAGTNDDLMMSMDFINDVYEADEIQKTFLYSYDITVFTKAHHKETSWTETAITVEEGALNNLTDVNTILFIFNSPIKYDLIMDVTYHAQPTWENRP